MNTTKVLPEYGKTYADGWIGFSRAFDSVGDAIAYGEESEKLAEFPSVNHAFIVVDKGTMVEALMDRGVVVSPLSSRLNDPTQRVYFRRPCLWTPGMGTRIATRALSKVGCKYAKDLILEQALSDTALGREINRLLDNVPHETLATLLNKAVANQFDCSGLASWDLAGIAEFAHYRLFAKGTCFIDPQTLFQFGPFEPFIHQALS